MQNIIKTYFDLHADQARITDIKVDIQLGCEFKGTNLWALVAAILIASVGLNTSSTAVVIGAMLISPLMGPIVGTGYALATFDFELLKTAGRNFFTFVVISLLTSAIFFGLSPFDEPTPEMNARIYPTIYDVLIAFFGGVAGIVAYTRKETTGNIIPGVAIATALMPPLCTAGYGLANPGDIKYFAGAIYLFIINSVMIAFATFAITKLVLRSGRRKYEDPATKRRVTWIISLVMAGTVLPSIWLAYNLLEKNQFDRNAQSFIKTELEPSNIPILKTDISYQENRIGVFTLGEPDSLTKARFSSQLNRYNLKNTRLDFKSAREYIVEKEREHRTAAEQEMLRWRDSTYTLLSRIDRLAEQRRWEARLLRELAAVDTNITAFGIVPMHYRAQAPDSLVTVLVTCPKSLSADHNGQIQRLLETKFEGKKVAVKYTPE
ncbi:MAG: DUF389 domain-containing protein [Saprospiraceae bacterium]|nr:DUF389 domain-containing protein [Saprospiraceae bacterium]